MKRADFRALTDSRVVILDGATGTELMRQGLPPNACVEQWALEHPDGVVDLQRAYREAGSDIVYTCTFGANRFRLAEHGLASETSAMNEQLARLSRQAVGDGLVFGDLAPSGRFVAPLGDLPFEELVDAYKQQVTALLKGGVDGFAIETMMDIQTARAALLAVRETCDLPAMVSINLDDQGRALTGADLTTAVITLQSLGADAVGCNCSTGPADMIHHLRRAKPHARVPLLVKPNAGMPSTEDENRFDMGAEEFASFVPEMVRRGVNLIGGCCGTDPDYIRQIREKCQSLSPVGPKVASVCAMTSSRTSVFFGSDQPVHIIGERINPTGKQQLQAELRDRRYETVRQMAIEQIEHGAMVLDVNLGLSDIDEASAMVEAVTILSTLVASPLSIDTPDPEVAEAALRLYPGRALMNSVSAQPERLEKLLPVAAKYGAMLIVLPMAGAAMPGDCAERIEAAEQVLDAANGLGYTIDDVLIDGMAMAISADPGAARHTLDLIEWATRQRGAGTVVGLSNTSFGLPGRAWLNASFLAAAIGRGLTSAIANPADKMVMSAKYAADAWRGQDEMAMEYIRYFRAVLSHHEIIRRPKAPEPEPVLSPDGDIALPERPEESARQTLVRRMANP